MQHLHLLSAFFMLPLLACQGSGSAPELASALDPARAVPKLPGPRRTVAVARFDAIDSFTAAHGAWDVGGGLAAMLTSALVESGSFVVLERPELDHVLSEQHLAQQGLVKQETAPATGALTGAQFLIMGSVTEFGEEDSGGGFRLGLGGFLGDKAGSAGLGQRMTKGHVALDVRVVDATTGEVAASFSVREKLSRSGVGIDAGLGDLTIGGDGFKKTPLGQAARRAIDQAVTRFAAAAAARPWQGRVVRAEGFEAVVNVGAADGVQVGDVFAVQRVLEVLTDPETGVVLGQKKQALGTLEVIGVDERVATATWKPSVVGELERGDVVTTL